MTNNLKKVISSAAVVAMVASSASAFAVTFPDVDATANYAGAVQTLSALNIVQGDDNGLFNPDNNVTRGEFTKMVVEALGEGSVAEATTTSQFTDAANTTQHWAAGYIATGVSEGWINGYGDGTFGPDDSVTYVQAVKMLVSAIGYESYAQNQGGWPSGYLQFGNSLDIIDGVSVSSNDAELTRAQCAVLVANALEAPVVEYGDMTYGGILGNIPVQNLQQMNGTGEGWQTLLTRKHDSYVVRGRVDATSRTNEGLDSDEVSFIVEAAENFDGVYYGSNGNSAATFTVKINDTNAANMLFEYAEAIIQKDEDTDEYRFISITQYGANRTVEFDADLYSDLGVADSNGRRALNVYRSESSSSTTSYRLASGAQMYVNGVNIGEVNETTIAYLADDNAVGNVQLIDRTTEGSTSTDGYYDYVTVDYYVDAVVDSVSATSANEVRVYFKNNDTAVSQSRLTWALDDEDVTVNITKDDAAIEYTDLQEYDVLSIAYDVRDFAGSSFYDIRVAQNQVTGSVSSRNTQDETITIDGSEYDVYSYYAVEDFEFNTEYTLYLDAFGRIAYYEEGSASRNYGVIVAMYRSAGSTYPTVRLLIADGTEVTYEVRNDDEAKKFYQIATTGTYNESTVGSVTVPSDVNISLSDIESVGIQNCVVNYRLSSGRLVMDDYIAPRSSEDGWLTYNASRGSLGNYLLDETATTLLDIDSYLEDQDSSASVMSMSSLTDDADYQAYMYDRSDNTSAYRFVLVTAGTSSINVETNIAIVNNYTSTTMDDGTEYVSIPVYTAGSEESQTILYDGPSIDISEGDVIIYSLKGNGTTSSITKVMNMNTNSRSTYENFRSEALSGTSFTDMIETAAVPDPTNNEWAWQSASKEGKAYFGPIYRKNGNNLELLVSARDQDIDGTTYKVSDLNSSDLQSFAVVGDVDTYVYDYSYTTGGRGRVYTGNLSSSAYSIYSPARYQASVENVEYDLIKWSSTSTNVGTVIGEDVRPNFAFVKTVDDDVTEVVYFVAN